MTASALLGRSRRQGGAVLLIGMIMLLMITLIAVSLIRMSTRHTQVVNNEQLRTEAVSAANYALDTVLNQAYVSATWNAYKLAGTTVKVNLGVTQAADSADGTGAMSVTVSNLNCKRGRVLKNSELFDSSGQITDDFDKTCIVSGGGSGLLIGGSGSADKSLCGTVLWDLQAQANDAALLSASVPVVQGVELRALATDVDSTCK